MLTHVTSGGWQCRNIEQLQSSVESKSNFHTDLHIYRPSVLHSRLEAPLLHSFNCSSVQPKAQAMDHTNVTRMPLVIDDQPKHARSLCLGVTGLLSILRIRRRDSLRS